MLVVIRLLVLCLILVSIPELGIVETESRMLVVPDDYATIQEAVHNAVAGDTVFVKSGTYNESVLIYKPISIMGENEETTVIVGDYRLNGTVVLVNHDNVNVTGFTIQSPDITTSRRGVHLLDVSNCNISGNKILHTYYGIWLYNASENTINENALRDNSYGVQLEASTNNIVSRNLIYENRMGIVFIASAGNKLSENSITTNERYGIKLDSNSNTVTNNIIRQHEFGVTVNGENNVLRNNTMEDNNYNFGVDQNLELASPSNDIDVSNTVEGKPVIYWVNQHDRTVPPEAGYVALINCTRITAENLDVSSNCQGILLGSTSNSKIAHNIVSNCFDSIVIHESLGNVIYENDVLDNSRGIIVGTSVDNMLYENRITENQRFGVDIRESSNNSVFGNTISATSGGSSCGIKLTEAFNNSIYGNNINSNGYAGLLFDGGEVGPSLNNTAVGNNITKHDYCIVIRGNSSYNSFYLNNFLEIAKSPLKEYTEEPFTGAGIGNCFDNGTKGNYWSSYNGTDANLDGVGDTPYIIDDYNQDNYPLMNQVDISEIPEFTSELIVPLLLMVILVVFISKKRFLQN